MENEQKRSEDLQISLNKLQSEFESLKLVQSQRLASTGAPQLSEHVLETVILCYRELLGEELPQSEGDMVLQLLNKLTQSRAEQAILHEKDVEILTLTHRLDKLQIENQKFADALAVFEGERSEVLDHENLRSLYKRKTQRVDELNKILDDKNRDIEKLKDTLVTGSGKKEIILDSSRQEELSQDIEKLQVRSFSFKVFPYNDHYRKKMRT